jgi:DNA-binding PadR family transcriptional regulator
MPRRPDTSPQTLRLFRALLADPSQWRYGYDLSRETELASGTLYPILMRLAEREFLDTRWEPAEQPGRPPRHIYRLTDAGADHARERLAEAAKEPTATKKAATLPTRRLGGAQ